jgi:hypothetical protein
LVDALVTNITACGGNCCANSFFFYSYLGDGHFQRTSDFGYSWVDPKIEKWKGRWSVVVTSNDEGVNTDAPYEITERYVLDAGKAVKVEESVRKELVAKVEIRSEEFDFNENDETRSLSYDLDGDDIKDECWIVFYFGLNFQINMTLSE